MEQGEPMFHLTEHCVPIALWNLGSQNELRVGKFGVIRLHSIWTVLFWSWIGCPVEFGLGSMRETISYYRSDKTDEFGLYCLFSLVPKAFTIIHSLMRVLLLSLCYRGQPPLCASQCCWDSITTILELPKWLHVTHCVIDSKPTLTHGFPDHFM